MRQMTTWLINSFALMCSLFTSTSVQALSLDPNTLFHRCCEAKSKIQPGCYKYCNYEPQGFSAKTLPKILFGINPKCAFTSLAPYLLCASLNHDHSEECRAQGVGKTISGDVCIDLCNLTSGRRIQLTLKHWPCMSQMDKVRGIMRAHAAKVLVQKN